MTWLDEAKFFPKIRSNSPGSAAQSSISDCKAFVGSWFEGMPIIQLIDGTLAIPKTGAVVDLQSRIRKHLLESFGAQ